MTDTMTILASVDFHLEARGRRRLAAPSRIPPGESPPPGRVPRVARLMALALRFDEQVRRGELATYSELARLGHVTRARVSQIMNLVHLAPDIQEALLFLPRTVQGRDTIHLRLLQPIAAAFDWKKQRRRLWKDLTVTRPV